MDRYFCNDCVSFKGAEKECEEKRIAVKTPVVIDGAKYCYYFSKTHKRSLKDLTSKTRNILKW